MLLIIAFALVCASRAAVIIPQEPTQVFLEVPVIQDAQDAPLVFLRDLPPAELYPSPFQAESRYDKQGCNHQGGYGGGYPPQRQPCPYRKWPCDPYYYY